MGEVAPRFLPALRGQLHESYTWAVERIESADPYCQKDIKRAKAVLAIVESAEAISTPAISPLLTTIARETIDAIFNEIEILKTNADKCGPALAEQALQRSGLEVPDD